MILGFIIVLRLLFMPCFAIAMIKRRTFMKIAPNIQKSDLANLQPNQEQSQRELGGSEDLSISFVRKWIIKIGMSLLILSQSESYVYAASSSRVKKSMLDIISASLNLPILVMSLIWLLIISKRKTQTSKA